MTQSRIQWHILGKLLTVRSARYRDLRPTRTPNDLFNYHLQQLVAKRFVEKTENAEYSLTEHGAHYITEHEPLTPDGSKKFWFKSCVVLICLRRGENQKFEVLEQERHIQPYFGQRNVMGGLIRRGEGVTEAAKQMQAETRKFLVQRAGGAGKYLEAVFREGEGKLTDEAVIARVADHAECQLYRWYIRQVNQASSDNRLKIMKTNALKAKDPILRKTLVNFAKACATDIKRDDLEEMVAMRAKNID